MKVFISWSGGKSKAVAEALYEWLPTVILTVRPWLSLADIDKGARWRAEVAGELEESQVGIICLTPDNLNAPWLLFEAGALSKIQQKSYVCTFLYNLEPTDVREPLAQFQHTLAQKDDVKKLVHTINRAQGDKRFTDAQIDKAFERGWPELEENLNRVGKTTEIAKPEPTEKEMLKELLELARAQTRKNPTIFLLPSERSLEPYQEIHKYIDDDPKDLLSYKYLLNKPKLINNEMLFRQLAAITKEWNRLTEQHLSQQPKFEDQKTSVEEVKDENDNS
jgi:hypothetical protein